jgi:hypothetical protein
MEETNGGDEREEENINQKKRGQREGYWLSFIFCLTLKPFVFEGARCANRLPPPALCC